MVFVASGLGRIQGGRMRSMPMPPSSGSKRRFYDGHDRKVDGSTRTQASLLRPWIHASR